MSTLTARTTVVSIYDDDGSVVATVDREDHEDEVTYSVTDTQCNSVTLSLPELRAVLAAAERMDAEHAQPGPSERCGQCEHWVQDQHGCGDCGLIMTTKTRWETCPRFTPAEPVDAARIVTGAAQRMVANIAKDQAEGAQ